MSWQQQAKAYAQSLAIGVGSSVTFATGNIEQAAKDIAKRYPGAHAREVEAEIRRHIRK